MTGEYEQWMKTELNPAELFRQFENKYMNMKNPETKFIAIASYYCGGIE